MKSRRDFKNIIYIGQNFLFNYKNNCIIILTTYRSIRAMLQTVIPSDSPKRNLDDFSPAGGLVLFWKYDVSLI